MTPSFSFVCGIAAPLSTAQSPALAALPPDSAAHLHIVSSRTATPLADPLFLSFFLEPFASHYIAVAVGVGHSGFCFLCTSASTFFFGISSRLFPFCFLFRSTFAGGVGALTPARDTRTATAAHNHRKPESTAVCPFFPPLLPAFTSQRFLSSFLFSLLPSGCAGALPLCFRSPFSCAFFLSLHISSFPNPRSLLRLPRTSPCRRLNPLLSCAGAHLGRPRSTRSSCFASPSLPLLLPLSLRSSVTGALRALRVLPGAPLRLLSC